MKILVTGGAGFIGSHIVDAYVHEGDEVHVVDDLSSGTRKNVHPQAKFHKLDIRSKLLEKLFKHPRSKSNIPDLDRLESELRKIRHTGVAVDSGGLGEGISSVAVAVRDYAGKVVGAITMLGPSFRMLAGRLESEIIPSMLEGAEMLSEKFGYARA